MTMRTGRCLCGQVAYTLKNEPRVMAVCHCTHCRRQSGSVFSTNVMVAETDYDQSGETRVYQDVGDSGEPVWRHFCGACGSPILSKVAVMPGMLIVKAGTLDDWSGLTPAVEVYGDHAAAWVTPLPNARRFAQGAG